MAKLAPIARAAAKRRRRNIGAGGGSNKAFTAQRSSEGTVEHARTEFGDRHDVDEYNEQADGKTNRQIALAPAFLLRRR
jgi:hypothetical protein